MARRDAILLMEVIEVSGELLLRRNALPFEVFLRRVFAVLGIESNFRAMMFHQQQHTRLFDLPTCSATAKSTHRGVGSQKERPTGGAVID